MKTKRAIRSSLYVATRQGHWLRKRRGNRTGRQQEMRRKYEHISFFGERPEEISVASDSERAGEFLYEHRGPQFCRYASIACGHTPRIAIQCLLKVGQMSPGGCASRVCIRTFADDAAPTWLCHCPLAPRTTQLRLNQFCCPITPASSRFSSIFECRVRSLQYLACGAIQSSIISVVDQIARLVNNVGGVMRECQVRSFLNTDLCVEAFWGIAHVNGCPGTAVNTNGSRSNDLFPTNIATYATVNMLRRT